MPHLPPLGNAEATDEARAALETLQAKLGRVPNMYRTFAHAPRVLDAAVAMAQAIRTDLDPKLRELAYLKVTQLTDCHVCRHYHEALGQRAGLTERQISDLGRFEQSDVASGAPSPGHPGFRTVRETFASHGSSTVQCLSRTPRTPER